MTDEQATPNPEGSKEDSGEQPLDYVSRRAAELRAAKEPKETEEKPEPEEQEPPEKPESDLEPKTDKPEGDEPEGEEEEEQEPETKSALDLSQVDYGALDEDSATALGEELSKLLEDPAISAAVNKGLGGGFGKDRQKLSNRIKELEEENAKLTSGFEKISPDTNAFSGIKDEAKLDETEQLLVELYDYYDDIAISNKWEINNDGDEGVYNNGKFFTRDEMEGYLRQWRKDLREIPKRRQQLQKHKTAHKRRDKVAKQLNESFKWFGDKDSEQSKGYSELIGDPSVASAIKLFPDLEPTLMEAFAYTVEGRSKPKRKVDIPLRNKPKPNGGGENGASGSKPSKPRDLRQAEEAVASGKASAQQWAVARSQKYKSFFNKTN